jgi:SAM-dependent methyltransferase
VQDVVRTALDAALTEADERRRGAAPADRDAGITALDAGCGRVSALRPFRARIDRFVGADIHSPPAPLEHLDDFAVVDLCGSPDAFPPSSFDVILSSFTVEHFADPSAAFENFRRWLRPGGTLVITTVNRRHPFVAAYLGAPSGVRDRLQPLVKATAADAHRLVGVCNEPRALRDRLRDAGFERVEITLIGHLARAWGRRLPTFALGLVGDLLARSLPERRSTIVAVAQAG